MQPLSDIVQAVQQCSTKTLEPVEGDDSGPLTAEFGPKTEL